jgi:RND family efflux transporter MFP subunit
VSPGTYLGKVIKREQLKVVFYISEEVADRLTMGQSFHFTVTNGDSHEYNGFITKISPSADPINKKIRVEGALANEELQLTPEMFINVTMDISAGTFDADKVYVPMNAIIFGQNDRYVYVVENGQAVRRDIEMGEIYGMWVEVLSGVTKEDALITEGHRNLPPPGGVAVNVAS